MHVAESPHAGPVCCKGWFHGDRITHAFSVIGRPRSCTLARLGAIDLRVQTQIPSVLASRCRSRACTTSFYRSTARRPDAGSCGCYRNGGEPGESVRGRSKCSHHADMCVAGMSDLVNRSRPAPVVVVVRLMCNRSWVEDDMRAGRHQLAKVYLGYPCRCGRRRLAEWIFVPRCGRRGADRSSHGWARVGGSWTKGIRPAPLMPAMDGPIRWGAFAVTLRWLGGPHPVRAQAVGLARRLPAQRRGLAPGIG
jgi:hypothetical protein